MDVILDGPIILDLLELSTPEHTDYSSDLIGLIDKTELRKVTFQHVLDEVRGSIRAPLQMLRRGTTHMVL